MRITRLLPALPLTLLLVTCGGGGGLSPIGETWATFIRVDCDKAHACRDSYTGTAAEFEDEYGASPAACASVIQDPDFAATISKYEDAEAKGRLVHSAANAQICFDAWAAQSCVDYWGGVDPSPACEVIFMGNVGVGGACAIPDECASGACRAEMTCI